jgi:hypothetical protein
MILSQVSPAAWPSRTIMGTIRNKPIPGLRARVKDVGWIPKAEAKRTSESDEG